MRITHTNVLHNKFIENLHVLQRYVSKCIQHKTAKNRNMTSHHNGVIC